MVCVRPAACCWQPGQRNGSTVPDVGEWRVGSGSGAAHTRQTVGGARSTWVEHRSKEIGCKVPSLPSSPGAGPGAAATALLQRLEEAGGAAGAGGSSASCRETRKI